MTAAYRTTPNPVYTTYIFPNMTTSNPTHYHKTTLCTYICSIIQIQSVSLQNIINNRTDTKVRRILICSSVRSACTWKIVFKTENNELNELSECMLLENVLLFRKTSKNCKTSFYMIFSRNISFFALLYFKSF